MRELVARCKALLRRTERAAAGRAGGRQRAARAARSSWATSSSTGRSGACSRGRPAGAPDPDRVRPAASRSPSSPRTVLTRERLLAEVWDWVDASGTRTVDSHIKALRRKLGADLIRTVHGVGYAFEPPTPGDVAAVDAGDARGTPGRPTAAACRTCARWTGSARSRSSSACWWPRPSPWPRFSPGLGLHYALGPTRTLPLAIVISLVRHPAARPRHDVAAAGDDRARRGAMAAGDYSQPGPVDEPRRGRPARATPSTRWPTTSRTADLLRRELVANVSHELRTPGHRAAGPAGEHRRRRHRAGPGHHAGRARPDRAARPARDLPARPVPARGGRDRAGHPGRAAGRTSWRRPPRPRRLVGADKRLRFPVDGRAARPHRPGRPRAAAPGGREPAAQRRPALPRARTRSGCDAYRRGDVVVIDVVDHGPGIAREQRQRVFERFARGNSPAQTGQIPTGGTGLGLAIVRWAVSLHGGTVEVADIARRLHDATSPCRPAGRTPDRRR